MVNFHKHRGKVLVLVTIFAIAWAIWTLFLLPASETPYLPDPGTPVQQTN